MNRNKENGFTLVELLAVIAVLGLILIIAVPKVMDVLNIQKKRTLELTTRSIIKAAEEKYLENVSYGIDEEITCESVSNITNNDFGICIIEFDKSGNASVTLKGKGRYDGLYICEGNNTNVTASNEGCSVEYGNGATYIEKLEAFNGSVNGLIVDDTIDKNVRYAGAISDVKNKVYFNCKDKDSAGVSYGGINYAYASSCETWRIIGVFDTKSTYSETDDAVPRIKIVRDEVLDTPMAWDTTADGVSYINQWGETTLASDNTTPYAGASLKQYLNGDYYNSLSSISKRQIVDALWYTGAVHYSTTTAARAYKDERSDATGTGTTVNYTAKWVGKIGLIYTSDFGYAGTNCGDKTLDYYEESCGLTSNWLTPLSGYHWTITPLDKLSYSAWFVSYKGYASTNNIDHNGNVCPSLYLSPNVQIISGNGDTEPYILSL